LHLQAAWPGLACHRLCEAANAPQLSASASLHVQRGEGMPRLLSFCSWLMARGAGSVQRLTLQLREVHS